MKITISPGEAIDRLTILEIKLERIHDPAKQEFVRREYVQLCKALAQEMVFGETEELKLALKAVNLQLWEIEDALRAHEGRQDFGAEFVALARQVYRTNDRRAAIKSQINALVGSALDDVKSYTPYE